jgi:uncharacterized lipoprotein YddW (UPF0748 family)
MIGYAQSGPKREMRSTWLTTAWGMDWPSVKIPSGGSAYYVNSQKKQLGNLLDKMKEANINTVFFQVRSECDAMYQSSYEPWSSHLVEVRGQDPGYDPLEYAITEAHKRGMELHAWLNPYRFESQVGKYKGSAGDYREVHPDWVLEYPDKSDGKSNVSILDPGNPAVRKRIVDIVKEIISNYDVDGITFDDYFYAYGGTPTNLDADSQGKYKPASMSLHDWRRDNVNKMVAEVYQMIQENEPWVTFGLSPFGIWTTDANVAASEGIELPEGIVGMNAYQDIYCDPIAWLKEGTVDYVSPQLYWPTASGGQDYEKLGPWWSDVCNRFKRHLYVSHSLSSLDPSFYSAALKSGEKFDLANELNGMSLIEYMASQSQSTLKLAPTEYGKQIQINREADKNGAPGSVFFRTGGLYVAGFVNYLKTHEFVNQALAPVINWKAAQERSMPANVRVSGGSLLWDSTEDNVRYVVYAIPNEKLNNSGNTAISDYLIGVSYEKSFDLTEYGSLIGAHTFGVSVLDRYGNEFPASVMEQNPGLNQSPELTSPANSQSLFLPFEFKWEAVDGSEFYILEVAQDNSFTNIVYKRELSATQFAAKNMTLQEGETYYWRVISRKIGVVDASSDIWSFTLAVSPQTNITFPSNNASYVSLTPDVEWESLGNGYYYELELSKLNTFSSISFTQSNISGTTFTIPSSKLSPYETYYVRVRGLLGNSSTKWSDVVKFNTVEEAPDVPVILSPEEGAAVGFNDVRIRIAEEQRANSFRVELCDRDDFHYMYVKVQTLDAFNYEAQFSDLSPGKYYVRVRSNFGSSFFSSWSITRSFQIVATSLDDSEISNLKVFCPTILKNHTEVVCYEIPSNGHINISLFDLTGSKILELMNQQHLAGEYQVTLPSGALKKGMYILMIQSGSERKTLKLIK